MGRVLRIITCEKGRRNRLATLLQSSFFIQAMSLGQPWNDWIIGVLFVTKQGRNIAEQSKARDWWQSTPAGPQQNRHRWPRAVRMDFAPQIAGASQCDAAVVSRRGNPDQ